MAEMKCEHCGGPLVPGIPGDLVCLEDDCFQKDFQNALKIVRASEKKARYKKYLELKEEFDDE